MSIIFFYSKYSAQCKKLTKFSKQLENIKYICIDNSIARKYIQNDDKINIKYVPCILVLHDDGIVEKFEGENAFRWVTKRLPKQTPPQSVQQTPPQSVQQTPPQSVQQTPPQKTPLEKTLPQKNKKTNITSLKSEPSEKSVKNVKDLAQQMQDERNIQINLKKEN